MVEWMCSNESQGYAPCFNTLIMNIEKKKNLPEVFEPIWEAYICRGAKIPYSIAVKRFSILGFTTHILS